MPRKAAWIEREERLLGGSGADELGEEEVEAMGVAEELTGLVKVEGG